MVLVFMPCMPSFLTPRLNQVLILHPCNINIWCNLTNDQLDAQIFFGVVSSVGGPLSTKTWSWNPSMWSMVGCFSTLSLQLQVGLCRYTFSRTV